jgi:hypothetical protein
MQSNCNGPSIAVEQSKKSNDSKRRGGGENFKFPSSRAREKCLAQKCVELENFLCKTDPFI